MVRSLFLISLLPALALASHGGEHEQEVEVEHGTTLVLPSNIEQFPTIINDLSTYQTSAFLLTFPTGTLEPNPYPSGSASAPAPPTYGTGSAVPYPSSSGSSDQAPTPTATITASEPPVATTTMATSAVYAPPPPAESSAGGANATGSAAPAPTQIAAGNTFTVKLPVVLGALGLVFAML